MLSSIVLRRCPQHRQTVTERSPGVEGSTRPQPGPTRKLTDTAGVAMKVVVCQNDIVPARGRPLTSAPPLAEHRFSIRSSLATPRLCHFVEQARRQRRSRSACKARLASLTVSTWALSRGGARGVTMAKVDRRVRSQPGSAGRRYRRSRTLSAGRHHGQRRVCAACLSTSAIVAGIHEICHGCISSVRHLTDRPALELGPRCYRPARSRLRVTAPPKPMAAAEHYVQTVRDGVESNTNASALPTNRTSGNSADSFVPAVLNAGG